MPPLFSSHITHEMGPAVPLYPASDPQVPCVCFPCTMRVLSQVPCGCSPGTAHLLSPPRDSLLPNLTWET